MRERSELPESLGGPTARDTSREHAQSDKEKRTLRVSHRKATRDRIVAAVTDLVVEGHPAAISVPAVARRSGVSVATIYRYFPTKEALLDAAATIGLSHSLVSITDEFLPAADYANAMRELYREFARNVPLMRGQMATPAGRALRRTRRPDKRERIEHVAHHFGVSTGGESGRRFSDLAEALMSSAMFLEFHDQIQRDPDAAADAVTWAVSALAKATAREQQEDT